jgi:hypothetical protein
VTATADVYVLDSGNNRIQVFRQNGGGAHNRAIIVAGGGPYRGNHLWEATETCANFAYRALTYQGFTKESIYYLSSDLDLDLDGNGEYDDVDDDATNDNLERAIKEWAVGAENVVVYLVDHGGEETFRMRDKENLEAHELGEWLDDLQGSITGKLIVVYDACRSGSFLNDLAASGRIVVTSATSDEKAYFLSKGAISFSNYFWTQIFNGLNVFDAFKTAQQAVLSCTETYQDPQHPQLDDNGNGVGNESGDGALAKTALIGNGSSNNFKAPSVNGVSPDQTIIGTNKATVYAEIAAEDLSNLARVWAVIRPPAFIPGTSGNPVGQLPAVELRPVQAGSNRFEASYDGFTQEGTYPVAIYARDRNGSTCVPKVSNVSVNSPLTRKAILVAGVSSSSTIEAGIEQGMRTAYHALTYQGYREDTIKVLAPEDISGVDHDRQPATRANLMAAITTWAAASTQDLVVYLVGEGAAGSFKLNGSENLTAGELDTWLDTLQATLPGKVVVVYDAAQAGSFLPKLVPPTGKQRILLASAKDDQTAGFAAEGFISFSQYFWARVANGATVLQGFLDSRNALRSTCPGQEPELDDDGNGTANQDSDSSLARYYAIGMGMMIAADPAVIGTTVKDMTLRGQSSANLWAGGIISSKRVKRVFAVITPPGYVSSASSQAALDKLELANDGTGRWLGTYKNFSRPGKYLVSFFALDTEGNLSNPETISVTQPPLDLIVTKIIAPATAKRGEKIKVTVSVKNRTAQPVASFTMGLYRSTDKAITTGDAKLKTWKVPTLGAGAVSTKAFTITIKSTVPAGTYYLGAIADLQNTVVETRETNNTRVKKLVIQ